MCGCVFTCFFSRYFFCLLIFISCFFYSYHFLHLRSKTHVEIHEWVLYTCCCSTLCFVVVVCLLIISSRLLSSTLPRSVCLCGCVFFVCTREWVCVEFNCHKIIKKMDSRFGCFQYVSKLNSISLVRFFCLAGAALAWFVSFFKYVYSRVWFCVSLCGCV